MFRVDSVVVGAGVVGLAVARALALTGREVLVLEAAKTFGTETSSRNSEVVHAGLYYPQGSLKARLCVEGRHRLMRYCDERGVAVGRLGKLVVAAEAQRPALHGLLAAAHANGVSNAELWPADRLHAAEPAVVGAQALWSPSTAIVDSHGLMLAMLGDIEGASGAVAVGSPLLAARVAPGGFEMEVGGAEPCVVGARELVNTAGLSAEQVGRSVSGLPSVPRQWFARGAYFQLSGARSPFSHLVYPMPEPGGLGVHATLDLAGQTRFGPDVEWIDQPDYTIDPARADRFYDAIRRYWPGLPDGALQPAYCGVRPKLSGPGEAAADFLIQTPADVGVPGFVGLYGIESPGLTASLAIGDAVRRALD